MMKPMLRSALLAAALGSCGALAAQEPGWSLGLALDPMTDSTFGIAKTYGATLDAGYTWASETAGLPLRVTFGITGFPASGTTSLAGTDPNTYKIGLTDLQVGLDGYARLPWPKVKLFFGFTLNKWQVDVKSSYYLTDHFESGSVKGSVPGIKLGFRLGLEFPFSDRLTGQLVFQATELGTTSAFMVPADPFYSAKSGNDGVNPCWLQVGARYRF